MDHAPEAVSVGHAIVDVLAPSSDELVSGFGLRKGTMTLVDDTQAEKIYSSLTDTTEASGGSAANTAAGLASLGVTVEFVGKVRDDILGDVFTQDIRAAGVRFAGRPARNGPGTGRCLVMVTPDAEKTMCTNLGIGALLGPQDIDPGVIAGARVLYLEGYLYGGRPTDPAVETAVDAARLAGTTVALSLSDPSWVETHRSELDGLLDRVDLLFANEEEATAMAGAAGVTGVVAALGRRCPTVAVTRGAAGSIVLQDGRMVAVPAAGAGRVVDTTGAGDSFAAGYICGVIRGMSPERCARLGGLAAAEVVGHIGARPMVSLAGLAKGAGLLG
ncbi:MAG: adenosine kinase [Acidimicrobiales bacterium]